MSDHTHTTDPSRNPLRPRPTTYHGVKMRSRLEAAWAEQFDAWGWAWDYEPECFASDLGQYLPDFRVKPPYSQQAAYVEVKPAYWLESENWGWTGSLDEIDGWAAGQESWQAEVDRMDAIVSVNTALTMFLLCVGSDDHGRAAVMARDLEPPKWLDVYRYRPLTPVQCLNGHTSLLAYGPGATCRHCYNGDPERTTPTAPVSSLYAPGGWNGCIVSPSDIYDATLTFGRDWGNEP